MNENIQQLCRELIEVQQRNDLFRKCTARALTLWQERHPDSKMWPDTAKNLCWLAEENERLRDLVHRMSIVFDEYARDGYVPDLGLGRKYRAALKEGG